VAASTGSVGRAGVVAASESATGVVEGGESLTPAPARVPYCLIPGTAVAAPSSTRRPNISTVKP
jgi:hypothetical protein